MVQKVIIVILIFFCGNLCAQDSAADSLYHRYLDGVKDDRAKVDSLNALSSAYFNSDQDLSAKYDAEAQQLAVKINYARGTAVAFRVKGNLFLSAGRMDSALTCYLSALKIYQDANDKTGEGSVYQNMGILDYTQNNMKSALENFNHALSLYGSAHDSSGYCEVLNNIGAVQFQNKDKAAALKNYLSALDIGERTGDHATVLNALNNIGNYYRYENDFPHAISYLSRSVEVSMESSNNRGIALALVNLAAVYGEQKDYARSIGAAQAALGYAVKANALDLERDVYQSLAQSYSFEQKYDSAYSAQVNYSSVSEKMLNDQNARLTREMEAKYKNEQNRKQITQLSAENKTGTITIYIISTGLVLLLFAGIVVYRRSRVNLRTAEILAEQKKLIETKNTELERLSLVARSTENIVLIMDANGKVEWANESFARWNGITIEELKAKKGETIYEISNNPDIRKIIAEAVREKKSVAYESLNRNPEGEAIWESSTLTPIFDETGKLQRLIIVDTNITQRKNDEEIIRQKNKDITDSITYARRIQEAILPPAAVVKQLLPDSFILYKPKDIVSGDFYWVEPWGDVVLFAAVDCTGHGVPGAFMSLLGYNLLNQAVNELGLTKPSLMLNAVSKNLGKILRTAGDGSSVKDGMDIALCALNRKKMTLEFSGAFNPAWIIRKGNIIELAGDKFPVGLFINENKFRNQEIQLEKGDCIYIFTDGFADQFGGPKGKKFKYRQLDETLRMLCGEDLTVQKERLEKIFDDWKGDMEQVDDVLLLGIRV